MKQAVRTLPGLWVVGVPIGNLADMSPRAKSVLTSADLILCEDTRRTAQLLQLLGVESFMPRLNRFDAHSRDAAKWINQIKLGKSICLVSDAGTPGISDPGALLVQAAALSSISVCPIPGPSAMTALLSICGFPEPSFAFRGFYPRKDKEHELEVKFMVQSSVHHACRTFVYFESPLRIAKTLERIALSLPPTATMVVAKELTKLHEQVFRGATCREVAQRVSQNLLESGEVGEWCFAVYFPRTKDDGEDDGEGGAVPTSEAWGKALQCLLQANVSVSESAKQVAQVFGVNKKEAYKEALRIKAQ
ncbi:hypothetical protein BASA81_002260 [Batrachochytrium salamandrivorans]|nr:hypothetical protein BASA81_002260 [Batrachochytrium salamandrivorans]